MKKIYLDFETFWSQDHSLTKVHPVEYVMHPETEVQSVAIKEGDDGETFVLFGEEEIQAWVDRTEFSNAMLIGHNMAGFDAMICAWRFGIKPKAWSCTMAIARALGYAKTGGLSLKRVAAALELGAKLDLEATNTKGKKLADFTHEEIESMRRYNVVDTELCAGIFNKLAPKLGIRELRLIDMTIRMLVEPQFELDFKLLEDTLEKIQDEQEATLLKVAEALMPEVAGGMKEADLIEESKKILASAPKFAKFLESKGVLVPMKESPSNPEKQIPALAKTDEEFLALQEHEDIEIAAAASARLGVKSTILESRIEQFLRCGRACPRGMPIALNYYGADTTGRWSGTMKMNQQNLPRVNPAKPKPSDALRKCLLAPKGKRVVVADLSGIELRVNHFLWKEPVSMQLFIDDPAEADLYKDFASKLYKKDVDEVTKAERQVGKVAHLGLGYGAGAATFQKVARLMGGVDLSLTESEGIVSKWRNEYGRIASGWRTCHGRLSDIHYGHYNIDIDPWGLCKTTKGGIKTPLGMIRYPDLRQETNEETGRSEWVYGHGRKKARIYAGKVTENCLAEGTLVLTDSGWKPIEKVRHDDLVFDGVEFVNHKGTLFKSVQPCVTVDGVRMTADHEVLTNAGWKEASQIQGFDWAAIRYVDRDPAFAQHWENLDMGVPVRLREGLCESGGGCGGGGASRRNPELWVRDFKAYECQGNEAWDVETPSVRGVSEYDRPLQTAIASGLAQLWRAWGYCVRSVARELREFLGGYGFGIPARAYVGAGGQRVGVLARELSVGDLQGTDAQQEELSAWGRYSYSVQSDGHFSLDPILPTETRAAASGSGGQAQSHKVYDILDAGPRHRFVVKGASGPFIVHNCVQHLAREVMADMMIEVQKRYPVAHTVHDEIILVVDEAEAEAALEFMQGIMRAGVSWWPELVTWSEGGYASDYGSAEK